MAGIAIRQPSKETKSTMSKEQKAAQSTKTLNLVQINLRPSLEQINLILPLGLVAQLALRAKKHALNLKAKKKQPKNPSYSGPISPSRQNKGYPSCRTRKNILGNSSMIRKAVRNIGNNFNKKYISTSLFFAMLSNCSVYFAIKCKTVELL